MSTSNDNVVDLTAYCARIGYAGKLDVTMETLRNLITHHIAAIPFENIDVLLGRGVDIAPAAVDNKFLAQQRGGYCFEHNGLFKRVLAAIGFRVDSLAARVLWRAPEGAPPRPRTHCALRVALDGHAWLVDVGFGGWVPNLPLQLDLATAQHAGHEAFRVVPQGSAHIIETELDGVWRQLYELAPEPLLAVDYEPLNWFTAAHPSSIFLQDLMVARTTPDIRYMLMNGRLTIHHSDGSAPNEKRILNANELAAALHELFGLTADANWKALLERIARKTDATAG